MIMKRVLSLLLVLVCTVSFTACGGEKQAKEAADGFMQAFVKLDGEAMAQYVDDPSEIQEAFENFDVDAIMETLPAELEPYFGHFEGFMNDVVGMMKNELSYEIKEIKKNGDEFIAIVDVTYPSAVLDDDFDIEGVLGESLGDNIGNEIIMELFNSGEISLASTEEEIMNLALPKVFERLKESLKEILKDVETQEIELVIIEENGKWLVNAEKSEFDILL